MKTQTLAVDLLRIDAGTQSRIAINEDVVEDYAELIAESNGEWPLGTLDVFHDGSEYYVSDGFHRTLAAQRAKRASLPCRVHKGTARDAHIFGMTANDRHGLRMTRADKRACVEWLLDNGGKLTQTKIAELAGVTRRTVAQVVADRKQPPQSNVKTSQTSGGGEEQNRVGHPKPSQDGSLGGSVASPAAGHSSTSGEDDPRGREPEETPSRPPRNGKDKPVEFCPNCAGIDWEEDDEGVWCAKCHHPHGEPAGDVGEDRVKIQRSKTVKTAEALMRAFDDLHEMCGHPDEHAEAIASCKILLKTAKDWKC